MSEHITTAQIVETGESTFAVNIEVSGHRFKGDEPAAAGGGNLGPAPYDLLLAALGECTALTVRWYAKSKQIPLEKVEVKLSHRKELHKGNTYKTDVFIKEILLHGEKLSDEQRTTLKAIAAQCPIQRTLENRSLIHTLL